MKIAIDARFLGPEGAGLGKYAEKLLEHLQEKDKVNEYFVILRESNFQLFKQKTPNFKKILVDARWYSVKEQFVMPKALNRLKPDLVHFLHYNIPLSWRGKFIVTIYDLTKYEFGKQASTVSNPISFHLKQTFHNLVLRKAIKRSAKIIAGSHSTEKKLLELFGVDKNKIITIYAGVSKLFLKIRNEKSDYQEILKKYKIKKPYVMYVGNSFPYKNLDLVLESLKLLKADLNFVYVSSRDVFVPQLVRAANFFGVEKRLVITGYVPDEDLAVLYGQAECYVFPSLSEGFGLPGLEAMASGCSVLASDIQVLREVYNDAALYFDPKSSSDLAEKINKVIDNQSLKTELVKKGLKQVDKYSWEKTASPKP